MTSGSRSRISRRELLALLGVGAGGGLISVLAREAAAGQAGAAKPVAFPRGAIIRTLLKDMPPESLGGGPVLFHEHFSIRIPPAKEHFSDDVPLMVDEARAALKDGIACIVDGGHDDMGRSVAALMRITTESGLPVVASGGYYMQRVYPPGIASKSVDQITEDLVRDARAQRFGAFGEIGQQSGELTADERKVFQAIGKAHVRTGIPVFTHNPYTGKRTVQTPVPSDAALRQLDVLESVGAKPRNLAIGHVCCLDDPKAQVPIQLAKRGAFVGFDRVTLNNIMLPDADRVVMAMALIEAGYADNLLLSSDFAAATSLKKNGGAGFAQTATVFGPMLLKAGLPETTLRRILVDNPRRFLAFVPKS